MDVDIPPRLIEALTCTSTSQQALAQRLHVGKSTVSHWVNGHREISVVVAGRIAEALRITRDGVELQVNAAWLAFNIGEMFIPATAPPRPRKAPTRAGTKKPDEAKAAKPRRKAA